jgi:hypothetical protein
MPKLDAKTLDMVDRYPYYADALREDLINYRDHWIRWAFEQFKNRTPVNWIGSKELGYTPIPGEPKFTTAEDLIALADKEQDSE